MFIILLEELLKQLPIQLPSPKILPPPPPPNLSLLLPHTPLPSPASPVLLPPTPPPPPTSSLPPRHPLIPTLPTPPPLLLLPLLPPADHRSPRQRLNRSRSSFIPTLDSFGTCIFFHHRFRTARSTARARMPSFCVLAAGHHYRRGRTGLSWNRRPAGRSRSQRGPGGFR
jgi:hypothetical protein